MVLSSHHWICPTGFWGHFKVLSKSCLSHPLSSHLSQMLGTGIVFCTYHPQKSLGSDLEGLPLCHLTETSSLKPDIDKELQPTRQSSCFPGRVGNPRFSDPESSSLEVRLITTFVIFFESTEILDYLQFNDSYTIYNRYINCTFLWFIHFQILLL